MRIKKYESNFIGKFNCEESLCSQYSPLIGLGCIFLYITNKRISLIVTTSAWIISMYCTFFFVLPCFPRILRNVVLRHDRQIARSYVGCFIADVIKVAASPPTVHRTHAVRLLVFFYPFRNKWFCIEKRSLFLSDVLFSNEIENSLFFLIVYSIILLSFFFITFISWLFLKVSFIARKFFCYEKLYQYLKVW